MRYKALACDFDETIAEEGQVPNEVLEALSRLRDSGRRLLLVTGREMDDLLRIFPRLDLFDRVVAENGGVLYRPAEKQERLLAEKPSEEFIDALRAAGISPLSVGRTIVASHVPNESAVLSVVESLGLELHLIFNKGALMVLPSGVNKATGLTTALHELGLSAHNVAGVGDAENDHAFLSVCEFSAAVSNAIPMLKKRVDFVTAGARGAGVTELIDRIIRTDLREFEPALARHRIFIGWRPDGTEWRIPPHGTSLLLSGKPWSGKTTFATAFLERLIEQNYQFCIVDPEGDYHKFEGAVVLGDTHQAPSVDEVVEVLRKSDQNAVVSLLQLPLEERPRFFRALFPRLQELRERTGRPHWIILDETHHLLPSDSENSAVSLPEKLEGILMITVLPEHLYPALLSRVDIMMAMGESAESVLQSFVRKLGADLPPARHRPPMPGEFIAWDRRGAGGSVLFKSVFPLSKTQRHQRKYTEGDLGPKRSFYFRGPQGRLNLRAQNLLVFLQIAEGIDAETWDFHLRRNDYSKWIRACMRDEELGAVVEKIESAADGNSFKDIRAAIEERYTLPV
jgi:HAD superfamily hydrolase (TIGR01484 family)